MDNTKPMENFMEYYVKSKYYIDDCPDDGSQ